MNDFDYPQIITYPQNYSQPVDKMKGLYYNNKI